MKNSTLSILLVVAVACAACGDDGGGNTDPDAGFVWNPTGSVAFAVGSTTVTGIASAVDIAALGVLQNAVAGVASGDPVVRHFDDKIFIINRFTYNNITVLDDTTFELIDQFSTGVDTNPYDLVVIGSTMYVAALAAPGVLLLNLEDPAAGVVSTIDLSTLDPDDLLPDCNSLHLAGTTLLVSCGALDGFTPRGPGKIAIIDTTTNTLTNSFELETANPFGPLRAAGEGALGGDLLVGTYSFTGDDYSYTQGCLERITLSPEPASAGCAIQNAELGGVASNYTVIDDTLYIAVMEGYDDGYVGSLRALEISSSTLQPEAINSDEQRIFDVASCPTGELVVADSVGSGLRVYNSASGEELTTELLDIGLPPVSGGVVCY